MRQLRHKQQGAVLILAVAAMVAMLGLVGLALDGGHAMLNKTRLQNTVDAAALSGAKELDLTDDTVQARAAAISAFAANAAADGNHELQEQYAAGAINITVQFSATLDPFVPGSVPAEYVRVRARDFRMPVWFSSIVGATDKRVSASAVAGPSPTINTACNIAPMMVCGDPDAGAPFWGYTEGEPDVLKASSSGSDVGPGNFQLIRLGDGQGGDVLRTNMAGGYDGCVTAKDIVITEPGNKVDPVARGLNTRFDEYGGSWNSEPNARTEYPPDVVTATAPVPDLKITSVRMSGVDEEGNTIYWDDIYQDGQLIKTGEDLAYNYEDYQKAIRIEDYDVHPDLGGRYLRRELALPIGDCTNTTNGSGPVPVLGFGCYFLLQKVDHNGNTSEVYGQFIRDCNAGGLSGPAPGDGPGLYIIQLYKDPDSSEA
jgi:Flp pilus assembly protein TadG